MGWGAVNGGFEKGLTSQSGALDPVDWPEKVVMEAGIETS